MSKVRPPGALVVLWLAGCSVNTPPPAGEAPVLSPPVQFTTWQRVAPSQDVEFPLTPETTAEQIKKVRAYDCHHTARTIWLSAYVKTHAEGKSLVVRMPPWSVIQGIWKPVFFGMDAVLDVCMAIEFTPAGSSATQEFSWPLELKDLRWAWCFAALAILGTLLIAGVVARAMRKQERGTGLPVLDLVLGPTGTYSLSRTQLLIWTLVTIFGLAFVWNMTERFLEITPQMLMFLGIASGTTVATRLAASGRISALPPRVRELVAQRRPRLADLIGVENRPSVVKLQMLIFTLITAIIVIKEIVTKFAFPELSEGLVTLMGISSATYVSSELASRVDVDRVAEYAKRAEDALVAAQAQEKPLGEAELRELPAVKDLVYLLDTQLP